MTKADIAVIALCACFDFGYPPVILALPGSHARSEGVCLSGMLGETLTILEASRPDIWLFVPVAAGVVCLVRDQVAN